MSDPDHAPPGAEQSDDDDAPPYETDGSSPSGDDVPPLAEMSLAQRIGAAWMQDPVRGVVVLFLLLFALSFLVAFAMWLF